MLIEQIKKAISKTETIKNIGIIAITLYPILLLLLNQIINEENLASYITYFIIAILFIPGTLIAFLENQKKTLIMLISFISIVIINYILHFNTFFQSIYIIIKNFITCYLMFMIVVTLENKEMFYKSLRIGGYISIILSLIYIIIMQNNKVELFQNGLTIQLTLIIFLPINLVYAFKEKKLVNIIFTIIGVFIISFFSSRTIIAAIWGFITVLLIIHYIKWMKGIKKPINKNVAIITTIFIIVLILMILINITNISKVLYNYLNERGIYVRILRLLSEGELISYSSGRTDKVYPKMFEKILEKPIIGQGIGMDRIYINDNLYYAHNIFLEIYVSYGIIIASIIFILIIFLIIKALKNEDKLFILGFIFSGLIILMLTTSYTVYRGFWILLGLLVNIYVFHKKEEKNEICINRVWKNFTKSFRSSSKQ